LEVLFTQNPILFSNFLQIIKLGLSLFNFYSLDIVSLKITKNRCFARKNSLFDKYPRLINFDSWTRISSELPYYLSFLISPTAYTLEIMFQSSTVSTQEMRTNMAILSTNSSSGTQKKKWITSIHRKKKKNVPSDIIIFREFYVKLSKIEHNNEKKFWKQYCRQVVSNFTIRVRKLKNELPRLQAMFNLMVRVCSLRSMYNSKIYILWPTKNK